MGGTTFAAACSVVVRAMRDFAGQADDGAGPVSVPLGGTTFGVRSPVLVDAAKRIHRRRAAAGGRRPLPQSRRAGPLREAADDGGGAVGEDATQRGTMTGSGAPRAVTHFRASWLCSCRDAARRSVKGEANRGERKVAPAWLSDANAARAGQQCRWYLWTPAPQPPPRPLTRAGGRGAGCPARPQTRVRAFVDGSRMQPRACRSPRLRLASPGREDSASRRRSRLLARTRLFTHPDAHPLTPGRSSSSSSGATRRAPARTSLARRPRYRLRAGSAALRRLGGLYRTRRDRDRLGAGDTAAPLLRAGGSASAPCRRAQIATIGGGGVVVARTIPARPGGERR